jgi:DNA gyrase/topoisomerase IV subunit A
MTDLKALIERLREHIGDAPSCPRLNCVQCEAADALEATVNELNGRDHDIVILEAELAEEKRKREEAEAEVKRVRGYWSESGDQIVQWRKQFDAARKVAIGIANRNLIGERTKPETVALDYSADAAPIIDAAIEAKMKEENR